MYSYSDFFAEKKFPTFCKGCHHSIGFVSVFRRRMNDCLVAPSLSVKHDCHVTPSLWNMIAPLPHLCETRYSRCPISVKQDCHFAPSVWNWIVTLPLLCETGLSLCPFSVRHNCPFAPSLWNRIVALPHLCETWKLRYPVCVKHDCGVTPSLWNIAALPWYLCGFFLNACFVFSQVWLQISPNIPCNPMLPFLIILTANQSQYYM